MKDVRAFAKDEVRSVRTFVEDETGLSDKC